MTWWPAAVAGVCGVAVFVVGLTFYLWRRAARNPHSRCPHCRKSLASNVPLVVASRRCYHCGRVVLIDPDEPPEPGAEPLPLPTRWEYTEADKKYQALGVPVILGGLFGSYIGCGGAGAMAGLFHLPPPFDVVVIVLVAAVVPVATVAVLVSMYQRAKRNPTLTCFWCGAVLAGHSPIVASTRRCQKCGRSALAPRFRPFPPPHAGPPFTVPQIDDRQHARDRVVWYGIIGVAGVLTSVGLMIALPFVWFGGRLNLEAWLTRQVGAHRAVVMIDVGPVAIALVSLFVVVAVVQWPVKRALKRHALNCPRCGKEFLPTFARSTRCCHHCHWPIVAGA